MPREAKLDIPLRARDNTELFVRIGGCASGGEGREFTNEST